MIKNVGDVEPCLPEAMAVGVTSNCNQNVRLPITRRLRANRSEKGLWPLRAVTGLPRAKLECQDHGKALSEAIASSVLFCWP